MHATEILNNIEKSPSDEKQYRGLHLTNGLKVLIASDGKSEKSAASISVAVGSMNDPPDLPGLAHLCEHMLFFESNKKKLNDFQGYAKFVSENGGGCNAYTTRDQTNYHFDIASSQFKPALKRFAKFFTTPPEFPEEALEKEIQIINSEYIIKLNNEAWRKNAVEACTAKDCHPFQQFSTGNKETLWDIPIKNSISILKRLRTFHGQYYSSNIMSLVVVARESLDELEKLIVSLFSQIEDSQVVISYWSDSPYSKTECGIQIDVLPIADVKDLYITFPIPDTRPFYKTFPHGYLTNLLAHKGPGSLFSFLYRKNWVNNHFMTSSVPGRGFSILSIGLQLTDEGLNNIEEILASVFQYIRLMKNKGPEKYFWEELKQILENQFLFQDQENPIDFVQRISNLLHVYPLDKVLSVGYLITEFDSGILTQFLECLSPYNCRVMTVWKENANLVNLVEKWYGVKYRVLEMDKEKLEAWEFLDGIPHPDFHHPKKNEFIPTKFNLKPQEGNETTKIEDSELCIAWFVQESVIPKAFVRIELFSPVPMFDPIVFNLNQILSLMIKESLVEELYGASLSGLNYIIKATMYGLEITVDGFDEKIALLTKRVIERIIKPNQFSKNRFESVKQSYENGLKNWSCQQPASQVPYYLSLLLRDKRFSYDDLLEASKCLNLERLLEYHKLLLMKMKSEWLIYGNVTKLEAKSIISECVSILKGISDYQPLSGCQSIRLREIELPKGCRFLYKCRHNYNKSSCCVVYLQIGQRNQLENIILDLIDQIIFQACFDQLRNKENLGYIVRTSVRKSNGTQGLQILVQGDESPSFVESRIENFLRNVKNLIFKMSEEDFEKHKKSVQLRKSDLPKKLHSRGNIIWNEEIYTREYNFNRLNEEFAILRSIMMQQVKVFYNTYIDPDSKFRQILVLHLISQKDSSSSSYEMNNSLYHTEIIDINLWKSRMGLYPLFC